LNILGNREKLTAPVGEGIISRQMGNDWHIPTGHQSTNDQHFFKYRGNKENTLIQNGKTTVFSEKI
jgi:hypothetical protein